MQKMYCNGLFTLTLDPQFPPQVSTTLTEMFTHLFPLQVEVSPQASLAARTAAAVHTLQQSFHLSQVLTLSLWGVDHANIIMRSWADLYSRLQLQAYGSTKFPSGTTFRRFISLPPMDVIMQTTYHHRRICNQASTSGTEAPSCPQGQL